MASEPLSAPEQQPGEPLRWAWVGIGVLFGSFLIGLFLYLVDPQLQRPLVAGLIGSLSLVLCGIFVGFSSRGETIRETAIAGVALLALTAVVVVGVLKVKVTAGVWLLSPFYAAMLAMLGGWVGEMLQGTLDEAHEDEVVDWPWVFVSVIIGFTLSTYFLFLGRELIGLAAPQLLIVFALSFLVTGWLVGFYSPGVTSVEPAIAALGLLLLEAGLIRIWFNELPFLQTVLLAFVGGILLAYTGGWLGERTQRVVERAGSGANLPASTVSSLDRPE